MSLESTFADGVADRTNQLVGLLFAGGAFAHFAAWSAGTGPGAAFRQSVRSGQLLAAAPEVGAYASEHPAYLLAFVAGLALLVRRS
ncbi:MAG: hypothetical protein ABEJ88_05130 [Halobacterium sp.]